MSRLFIILFSLPLFFSQVAHAGAIYDKAVRDGYYRVLKNMINDELNPLLNNSALITAIEEQNRKNKTLSQADIKKLDNQWRKESKSENRPLIDATLSHTVSRYLHNFKEASAGLYTEIFVMDNKGLNVAQSDVTSDYWQGDEDKWLKTYPLGKDAIHIGEIVIDESSQEVQVQLSVAISDHSRNQVIGAITIGVNLLNYQ